MVDNSELLARLDARAIDRDPISTDAAAAIRRQCDLLEREKDMYEASMRNVIALGGQLAAERKMRTVVKTDCANERKARDEAECRVAELEKREIGRAGKLALLQDRLALMESLYGATEFTTEATHCIKCGAVKPKIAVVILGNPYCFNCYKDLCRHVITD